MTTVIFLKTAVELPVLSMENIGLFKPTLSFSRKNMTINRMSRK